MRRTVAFGIHEVVTMMGEKSRTIAPHYITLLKDKNPEVQYYYNSKVILLLFLSLTQGFVSTSRSPFTIIDSFRYCIWPRS